MAEEIIAARKLTVDNELVRIAALLHDVGYYPLFNKQDIVPKRVLITHGVVGADLLRKAGMSESLARVAERHTGVGLTKAYILATGLPLPARDLVAETPEEWLILYVDKLHSKNVKEDESRVRLGRFMTPERYLAHARSFGVQNAANFNALVEKYGRPDLKALSKKYGQSIIGS